MVLKICFLSLEKSWNFVRNPVWEPCISCGLISVSEATQTLIYRYEQAIVDCDNFPNCETSVIIVNFLQEYLQQVNENIFTGFKQARNS